MSFGPRDIRSRLALGFAVAVAVTVLVYAGVVYAFTRASLLEQLDDRLHDDLERAEHAFEIAGDGSVDWKEVERPRHPDPSAEQPWAQVLNAERDQDIRWPAKTNPFASHWRIYEKDYAVAGETYRVRVGRSMEPLHERLGDLLRLLALCFAPVVLLAWLGGRLLARRALKPVEDMAERARDIGAERLSERLPVTTDDELGRLAAVFNDAFARIESSFESLKRFTADAAHEMRTPLSALRTVGEVGLGKPQDENREVIASMLEETDRLSRLVEQLLELARGDAGTASAATEAVDLTALSNAVVEQLEVLASEREQELVVEADGAAIVHGDRAALRRAITNLVDNAIRHGPPSARIHIRIGTDGERVTLAIEDEGPGISLEHRGRIFDRFYQADPSRAGAGTGLGLSLAMQALESCGGRVEYGIRSGGGSTFRITF